MVTDQMLIQLMQKRIDGEATFKEFLNELMENGIHEYEISVEHAMATYIGKEFHLQLDSPFHFDIADEFNQDRVYESIQNKELPIEEFLTNLGQAGVTKYSLYIPENVTVYYGVNGEVLEQLIS